MYGNFDGFPLSQRIWVVCPKISGFPLTNPMTWGWDVSTINPTMISGHSGTFWSYLEALGHVAGALRVESLWYPGGKIDYFSSGGVYSRGVEMCTVGLEDKNFEYTEYVSDVQFLR